MKGTERQKAHGDKGALLETGYSLKAYKNASTELS